VANRLFDSLLNRRPEMEHVEDKGESSSDYNQGQGGGDGTR
jgi:hypothetical protein